VHVFGLTGKTPLVFFTGRQLYRATPRCLYYLWTFVCP